LVQGEGFKVDLRRVCSHSEKLKQVWLFTRSIGKRPNLGSKISTSSVLMRISRD